MGKRLSGIWKYIDNATTPASSNRQTKILNEKLGEIIRLLSSRGKDDGEE